ncbi:DNA N-6-adenine-methyltransferase [Rhizorhabdus histidinilytica]|uniref:DNA N-6-adenine-methyltransferase (Dam) n=1 Tax=Rhizorhabdus histidinilytica TaxID=439228 RepID=A0A1T5A947_9SPHN|nr:DNA N-6-adenine-methyltransferase [Rhizorhabdus histidinilytica]SKB31369.1 DNA N-6-adenine-methyltransferase (Dam) [Rhizorhabdus histidinilytica]
MGAYEAAGESDEWYTPRYIFEALGVRFDLDVACPVDRTHIAVPADSFISEGSLDKQWSGLIWMNPPFGHQATKRKWLGKFFDHGNGIALTPDRTSAPWFREAWRRADIVLFTPKIKFVRPDGSLGLSPGTGTCLWAAGPVAIKALHHAADGGLGIVAKPISPGADQ